jgi:hypothetical protein
VIREALLIISRLWTIKGVHRFQEYPPMQGEFGHEILTSSMTATMTASDADNNLAVRI